MTAFGRRRRHDACLTSAWLRSSVLVVGLLTTGCTEASGPSFAVGLRTEVTPGAVASGDTVVLRAILTNPTTRRVDVKVSCGPPVLFEVRGRTGVPIYPISLDATFTCDRIDMHDLEPGETDTVQTRWHVNASAGRYEVRSGFRGVSGLERMATPAAVLTIR